MNEISLNASMRSNLFSLQQTQALQEMAQLRLSTGLKINSAIDNPSSYYTASSLNNRAQDLSQLLDAMSQGVQTLKAVSNALELGAKYLEQAKATAKQALDKAGSTSGPTPPDSFEGYTKVSTADELKAALNNATVDKIVLTQSIRMDDDEGIVLGAGKTLAGVDNTITLSGKSNDYENTIDFVTMKNGSKMENISIDFQGRELSGTLQPYNTVYITDTVELNNVNIKASGSYNSGIGGDNYTISGNINIQVFGLGVGFTGNEINITSGNINIETTAKHSYGIDRVNVNIISGNINIQTSGEEAHGISFSDINMISGSINIQTSGKNAYGLNLENGSTASGNFNIKTSGEEAHGVNNNGYLSGNINVYVSGVNTYGINSSPEGKIDGTSIIKAYSEQSTGVKLFRTQVFIGAKLWLGDYGSTELIEYEALVEAGSIWDLTQTGEYLAATDFLANLNMAFNPLGAAIKMSHSALWATTDTGAKDNAADYSTYQKQYNSILDQYNQLINDASYKGINLLLSQNLKINFNEDRSSKLEINGIDSSAQGLGLSKAAWDKAEMIEKSVAELESAIGKLRTHSAQFGNYNSIVSSREDFTENLINVLTEGSDKLTLADMNEESANMLALQTRQQLAINSLSLASQSGQSVLRLFL